MSIEAEKKLSIVFLKWKFDRFALIGYQKEKDFIFHKNQEFFTFRLIAFVYHHHHRDSSL